MRAAAAYPAPPKAAFLCIDDHENLLECEESFLRKLWLHGSDICQTVARAGTGFRVLGRRRNPGLPYARNESLRY
jgi:hypothetical protein